MLQGVREECILEPLNLACLKPLHYFDMKPPDPKNFQKMPEKAPKIGEIEEIFDFDFKKSVFIRSILNRTSCDHTVAFPRF